MSKEPAKKKTPVAKQAPTEQVDQTVNPVAQRSSKSPEKKKKGSKKRDTKGADEIAESKKDAATEPATSPKLATHDSQQKPKRKGKKRKSGEVEP